MAYNAILDTEIDPESPGTQSLFERLRDNPIAMILGEPNAPRATSRIITPGGSKVDGALTNATDLSATGPGHLEFSSMTITAPKAFPWISLVRIDGSCTLSSVISCLRPTSGTVSEVNQQAILDIFNGLQGTWGTAVEQESGGGGGAVADGGDGATSPGAVKGEKAILSAAFSLTNRAWLRRRVLVGGNTRLSAGGVEARGGGCIILCINGNLTATGGEINVDGEDGGGSQGQGGGGAGSLLVFCNGTIHDGTFAARGGDGRDGGSDDSGGGGGGGLVGLFAKAFTGTQTRPITGGLGPNGADPGDDGYDIGNITLSEEIINSILLGAVA